MNNQISMFELLGLDDTPEIPVDRQKKGVKGWVIEIAADFLPENGYRQHVVGVTTKCVILEEDTRPDSRGSLWQSAHVVKDGCNGDGWMGTPRKLYDGRPTWRELQEYVKTHYRGETPYEIVFVRKGCDASCRICDFETGKPIPDYFREEMEP